MPNLAVAAQATGDLTSAFNFAAPKRSLPALPRPRRNDPRVLRSNCATQAPAFVKGRTFPTIAGYPLPPPPQTMPGQEPGSPKRPSGLA